MADDVHFTDNRISGRKSSSVYFSQLLTAANHKMISCTYVANTPTIFFILVPQLGLLYFLHTAFFVIYKLVFFLGGSGLDGCFRPKFTMVEADFSDSRVQINPCQT